MPWKRLVDLYKGLGVRKQSTIINGLFLLAGSVITLLGTYFLRSENPFLLRLPPTTFTTGQYTFRLPSGLTAEQLGKFEGLANQVTITINNSASVDLLAVQMIVPTDGLYEVVGSGGTSGCKSFSRRIVIDRIPAVDSATLYIWTKSPIPENEEILCLLGLEKVSLTFHSPIFGDDFRWYKRLAWALVILLLLALIPWNSAWAWLKGRFSSPTNVVEKAENPSEPNG